jgi:hypothetical protein
MDHCGNIVAILSHLSSKKVEITSGGRAFFSISQSFFHNSKLNRGKTDIHMYINKKNIGTNIKILCATLFNAKQNI